MKLTLRTVSGGTTVFEVTEEETVGSVKAKMAEDYDLPTLKLCHKGKVLEDSKTFKDLGFGEAETLIIAGKKKALAAKAPAPATPAEAPKAEAPAEPKPAETPAPTPTDSAPAPAPAPSTSEPAPAQPPAPAPVAPAPAAAGPPVDPASVEFVMGMGFEDKAAVEKAIRCAFGNVDRAVEYMFSGIPASVEAQFNAQQAAPPARSPSVQQGAPAPGAAPGGAAPGGEMTAEQLGAMMQQMQQDQPSGSELENALRALPQFEQIRGLIQQNPAALPVVMQQLQQHSPELFALVQANPQEFLDIVQRGAGGGGGGAGEEGGDGGPVTMTLTEADAEPIQRLVSLGGGVWDARAATIVYLACRRNEEMAANVLLENGGVPPELADVQMQGGPEAE